MNIHGHSQFSALDAIGSPSQIAEKAKSLGHGFVALTEHGNLNSLWALQQAAQRVEIQHVFGVEGYLNWSGLGLGFGLTKEEKKRKDPTTSTFSDYISSSEDEVGPEGVPHVTLLCMNLEGYNNLCALMKLASQTENRKRGKPTFSFDQLTQHCSGLVVTSGCGTAIPSRLMSDNDLNTKRETRSARGTDEAIKYLDRLRDLKNHGALPVIEIVSQPGFRPSELSFEILQDYAEKHNMRCVLSSDAHFVNEGDFPTQDLALRIGTNNPYKEAKKIGIPGYQYFRSGPELIRDAITMGMDGASARQYVKNAHAMIEVFEQVEIKKGSYPKYFVKEGTAVDELRSRCVRGVTDRADGATRAERTMRLEHELDVINRKGLADYFLLLSDLTAFIRRAGYICVCRGSAGGSLVSFACGISQTDPIPQGLLFSRFYDEDRQDAPDIDLDFSPDARKKAVEFLASRYHTAKLLSLNVLTRKSAIIDTAAMLSISRTEIESALSVCNDELDDIRDTEQLPVEINALYEKYPKMVLCEGLIGTPRHASKNAAGIIVSSKPIPIPCLYDSDGELVTSVDKLEIDKLNLLKADLLSVRALGIIEKCMWKLYMDLDTLYSIDHSHPQCNEVLRTAMVRPAGLFQLDGSVLTVLERIVNADSNMFDECNVASALARPGAMKFVGTYAKREKVGNPILDETFGVIVYQETIMALCVGSTLPPNKLRKAVSKSQKAEVLRLVEEAGGLGLSPELLQNLLDSGLYSFNKSHCVTYTKVLLWMSYLKMNYPTKFLESYLNYEFDQADVNMGLIRRLINEEIVRQKKNGITVNVVPLAPSFDNDNSYISYDGKTLTGSWLATGLGSRKYLATGGFPNTAVRKRESDSARAITLNYMFGKHTNTVELLEVFPWVPVPTVDPLPLHTETERFMDAECTITYHKKLAQTKAMPYAVALVQLESGNGLIHGKVSAKNYPLYRRILDTKIGTKVFVEYSSVKSRAKIGTLNAI